jgi:hypothetical protein
MDDLQCLAIDCAVQRIKVIARMEWIFGFIIYDETVQKNHPRLESLAHRQEMGKGTVRRDAKREYIHFDGRRRRVHGVAFAILV